MAEISFKAAWEKSDPQLKREARAFWQGLGTAITSEEIEERLPQLCALAYDGNKVIAVSTAYRFPFPRLRSHFAYYRTAVADGYRRQRVAARLCSFSHATIQEWQKAHPEEKMQGLFIILQAPEFKIRQRD